MEQTESLSDLRKRLLKDGSLNSAEVAQLRDVIFDSEGMTMEKGNLLFSIKEGAQKGKLAPEFLPLFVEAITDLLLEDESSPGEIDEGEAKWLRAKIQYHGNLDHYDRALLKNLKKRSINFPKVLQYKSKQAKAWENLLYSSRYLSIIAVVGSLIAAIVLFVQGGVIVWNSCHEFLMNPGSSEYEEMFEHLVSSVDVFLFALVLIIFSVGVYELFINKIDPIERQNDSRPSWLQISSVDDLKSSLGKVILMVLIVSFFKYTLEGASKFTSATSLLYLAIGIFLISAALYLTHKSH